MNRFFMLLVCISLYSQANFECIGLGAACSTAQALHVFNLRNSAYPFDWVSVDFSAVRWLISEDFKDYLNPRHLKMREDNRGIINKYGVAFVHDFPTITNDNIISPDWLNFLPDVQEKYERRINRFIEKCNSKNKIYFFRHCSIPRSEAIQFRKLMESKYPNLDFVLVAVGNDHTYAQSWGEQKIRNYYLNDTLVWNDVKEWQRIFTDLGLISEVKTSLHFKVEEYVKGLCGKCEYCQRKKLQHN